ncbi:uncharacterized protein LOC111023708 isoform X3 [Momordica charantia]|uniref:Uncharacterized protein LOC111023708 isoform X2 n=1 Tax=Momordica charantia TaxID=3673 RepID=A0A6J1DT41_MOMCH|nr:uncharacterized protein LOC111023708 isoform X2 [Momordica charantia]XP_022156872.1 uncharacterized protein LOC111023708 isoform X3 [Momordica charantia]
MESGIQIVNKVHKTFVRRRRRPPPLPPSSLSSSSSVPLNPTLFVAPQTANPALPSLPKKTRDLPNFSECHACGIRVDAADGRSRLNSLYSKWRIVLLCKKCFSLVESSKVCSYCFADSRGDCFRCCECNRRVHRECYSQSSRVAPWSYSSSGSEFSVCIDCWVPKPIVTARAIMKSRKIRRTNTHVSDLKSSKVSTGGDCKSLGEIVKDANCLAEKKIDAASRAREHALKKAAVARRAAELASDTLNLVAQREEIAAKESGESADDAELAIQLHRSMNSSPRLSRNLCSVNSNYMAFENMLDDGDPSVGVLCSEEFDCLKTPQVLIHNTIRNSPDNVASEPSVTAEDHISPESNHQESVGKDPISIQGNACQATCDTESENVEFPLKEDLRHRSKQLTSSGWGCDCDRLCSEPQPSLKQDIFALPRDERCIAKPYHYFFKYRRRDTTKRYLLKYSKRNTRLKKMPDCKSNVLVDGMCLGVPSSSAAILISSSEKFPVISNAAFGSCAVPLQASGLSMNGVQEISNKGGR